MYLFLYVHTYVTYVYICSYWLDGVLPMVMDMETSAQEKCASLLEEVILSNITPYDE